MSLDEFDLGRGTLFLLPLGRYALDAQKQEHPQRLLDIDECVIGEGFASFLRALGKGFPNITWSLHLYILVMQNQLHSHSLSIPYVKAHQSQAQFVAW
jgi:hypothetical protein